MKTVLVCGGCIEEDFAGKALEQIKPDCIIGIDRGLNFCYKHGIVPHYILGDFDSIDREILEYYEKQDQIPVKRYKPEKDATDTRIGLELALKLKSSEIFILGATGGRLDHYMGNLQSLIVPLKENSRAWILDSQNAITVLDKRTEIHKKDMFGKYISFFSMGDKVEGLTLTGFKYPLKDYTMTNFDGIGVSNEILEEIAAVDFVSGLVLMVMSRDKK